MLTRDQTEQFLLTELLDPVVFLERFVKINTPDGMIDFNLEQYQKKIARDTSRLRVINKSRKTGISTLTAGLCLHSSIVESRLDNMVISTGEDVAEELLIKIYDMLYTLPKPLQPYTGEVGERKRKDELQFSNKSRIMSLPCSSSTLRGYGMRGKTNVWADEFAMAMTREPELWDIIRGYMVLGGNMSIISTPLGRSGKFYDIAGSLQAMYRGVMPPKETIWSYHEIPYTKCIIDGEVITEDGVKNIKDICVGDTVLTEGGEYKKVIGKDENLLDEEILEIKTRYTNFPLRCTSDHKILAFYVEPRPRKFLCRNTKKYEYLVKKYAKKMGRKNIHLDWIESGKLNNYSYLCYPITKETKDIEYFLISDYLDNLKFIGDKVGVFGVGRPRELVGNKITVSAEFLRICGYYLSEGVVCKSALKFYLGKDDKNKRYVKQLCDDINKVFSISPIVKEDGECTIVSIYRRTISDFFKEMFGNGFMGKKIPSWLITLPLEKQKHFIETIINGDGWRTGTHTGLGMTNKNVIFKVRDILLRFGIIPSVRRVQAHTAIIGNKKIFSRESYRIDFKGKNKGGIFYGNYVLLPIVDINKISYKGISYDLSIENNPSFCINYYTVHNCERLVEQFKSGILTMDTGIKMDKNEAEFKREFCCDFIEEGLSFFPYPMLYGCADVDTLYPNGYKAREEEIMYIGVDFAKKQDETAIVVVEKDKNGVFTVINAEAFNAKGMGEEGAGFYSDMERTIGMFTKLYNPLSIKVDQTGPGESVYDHLYSMEDIGSKVWGYILTNPFKENLIVNLRMLFERRKIRIPKETMPIGAKMISQLHAMEKTSTESGLHSRYSGKETGLDDLSWALALAVYEEFKTDSEMFLEVVSDPILTSMQRSMGIGELSMGNEIDIMDEMDL